MDPLQNEARSGSVELLPLDAMDARDFLEEPDYFLYWKQLFWIETGCTTILEAIAMDSPFITARYWQPFIDKGVHAGFLPSLLAVTEEIGVSPGRVSPTCHNR